MTTTKVAPAKLAKTVAGNITKAGIAKAKKHGVALVALVVNLGAYSA